ncbi:MAG: hypothetical protein ACXW31_12775 [Thermoanaerobaculia bacterium]
MRNIYRSASAVVLVLALAMPAGAAGRPSGSVGGFLQVIKRYVLKAASRLTPPVGSPVVDPPPPPPEDTTTPTTDAPITTQ